MAKRLTNEQLVSMSRHLCYEVWMLEGTARLWGILSQDMEDDRILKNALLESFTMHARVIDDFLFQKGTRDDVAAHHYLSDLTLEDWKNYLKAHGYSSIAESTIKEDINKRTAHFTETRQEMKGWPFGSILTPLIGALKLFVDKAKEGTLHESLVAWRNQVDTHYVGPEFGFSHSGDWPAST